MAVVHAAKYLQTVYEPECEYVAGILLSRNVGRPDHSAVQVALVSALHNQRRTALIHIFIALRIQTGTATYRVPDVAVTTRKVQGRILQDPPLLWIEVLSPEDRISRMEAKIKDILEFGTPWVWVLDPRLQKAWVYTNDGRREAHGALEIPEPKISVNLDEIFDLSLDVEP